jgi:hypothetical protein
MYDYAIEDAPWFSSYSTQIKTVVIGNSVSTIGDGAFRFCTELTSATIGSSVATIGDVAFRNCISLSTIICNAITPPVAVSEYLNPFINVPASANVYIPCGSLGSYQTAKYWANFTNLIEGNKTTSIFDTICPNNAYSKYGFEISANQLQTVGTYEFRDTVSTLSGCDSITVLFLTVKEDVGIAQWRIDNVQLKIYPNPTHDKLTIENEQFTIDNVEIYDVFGRKVYGHQVQGTGYQMQDNTSNLTPQTPNLIDISHLSKGVYFLKIGNRTARFVKE